MIRVFDASITHMQFPVNELNDAPSDAHVDQVNKAPLELNAIRISCPAIFPRVWQACLFGHVVSDKYTIKLRESRRISRGN